jgi:TolA-binding protein
MIRGYVSRSVPHLEVRIHGRDLTGAARGLRLLLVILMLWLVASGLPLMADTAVSQPPAGTEDFGQYLADHEADLTPFFSKNAEDLSKLAIPLVMGMMGWVVVCTMLVGWGIDVLMGRGFAFFFAPAHAEIKRCIIYATGRLFLSFVYTILMGLAVVLSLGLTYAVYVILGVLLLLLVVSFAAQLVWILYLYRTPFFTSFLFYLAIALVHGVVFFLIAKPILGSRSSVVASDFVDRAVTPRLQTEIDATRHTLSGAEADRDAAKAKVDELQGQINQAKMDQEQLRKEIEEKKNSDIYILSQILQARARGDLASARDQLHAFPSRFPSSSLSTLAQNQLAEITAQLAGQEEQKKQAEVDAARATAEARADLLMRAGKGEVTLSEMRRALIGKTTDQVSELLGTPSNIGSDRWDYRQQMIVNPMTNEKTGLTVDFSEGAVQGVDYYRYTSGGTQQ